jgi:predicted small lipoprotein YifL
MRAVRSMAVAIPLAALALIGCGAKVPPAYPVSGKVTLAGKAHNRLLVYFRPAEGPPTQYTIAVGETDKDGNLKVQGNAGVGLPEGEYKVTFTCQVVKGDPAATAKLGPDDKPSELGVTTVEQVPASHAEGKANDTTPVRFVVKRGAENVFTYDIPAK